MDCTLVQVLTHNTYKRGSHTSAMKLNASKPFFSRFGHFCDRTTINGEFIAIANLNEHSWIRTCLRHLCERWNTAPSRKMRNYSPAFWSARELIIYQMQKSEQKKRNTLTLAIFSKKKTKNGRFDTKSEKKKLVKDKTSEENEPWSDVKVPSRNK